MAKQPVPKPPPTGPSAAPVIPNPMTAITNEADNRGARLTPMSINPGRPAGGK